MCEENKDKLKRFGYQTDRGFTLVELLVVISIIALLLAVLMPALSKARENGRKVVCGANLKQIGISLPLYAADYQDKLPYFTSRNQPMQAATSLFQNAQFYIWGNPCRDPFNPTKKDPREVYPRPLAKYMKDNVYECKSDKGNPKFFGNNLSYYYRFGNSYPYNCGILTTKGRSDTPLFTNGGIGVEVLWGKKLNEVRSPSHVVASGDITTIYPQAFTAASAAHYKDTLTHDKTKPMCNVLFVDSHVKFLLMKTPPDHVVNGEYTLVLPGTQY